MAPRFEERNAQVLSISCDSIPAHAAWSDHLGGISFPMLSDWHPKGEVCAAYGVYDGTRGTPIRSVFVIDPEGTICWSRQYPAGLGLPDFQEVLAQVPKR